DRQLAKRGITDAAVLAAMRTVPRHLFIPEQYRDAAYDDGPQSIGEGQTISQPYIVASMTEHLDLNRESKVLEIGTGCGYQTAILAEITRHVYSIERIAPLLLQANRLLDKLGYSSIHTKLDDGGLGWPEEAPFDAIIVTAAATRIPQTLVRQLAEDGRMVIPVETGVGGRQELIKVSRTAEGISEERLYEVRFVPLCTDVKE
ncbi:MAG: protein-L-isoaspartate(D-aspartate) O-methyltransferase, partial [Chloroflexota bacterium]|nr:protein-L-isoaspartate(D-aspartate) O-methyltransferase [Chloroflexota bacterium]